MDIVPDQTETLKEETTMKKVTTYVYYRWETVGPMRIRGTNPDRYMDNLRRIVDCGYFNDVEYAGMLNCTCGNTDDVGMHYGFIINTDVETTKKILNLIEYDICESFLTETMEKLDKNYETMDEYLDKVLA